jgi:hypothetical protein
MSRSIHAAQGESLPYNHHLHQFLTFLKHERGFADATIVNRERSLKPFLGLAGRRRRATVHSVAGGDYQVLHRYRGGPVEADHRLVPCTVSALVFSLCQQSRLVRGGHRRVHQRTPGLHVRKSAARAPDDRGWECTSAVSEGGEAPVSPPGSLTDTQTMGFHRNPGNLLRTPTMGRRESATSHS